jgi:hypothetical protein
MIKTDLHILMLEDEPLDAELTISSIQTGQETTYFKPVNINTLIDDLYFFLIPVQLRKT